MCTSGSCFGIQLSHVFVALLGSLSTRFHLHWQQPQEACPPALHQKILGHLRLVLWLWFVGVFMVGGAKCIQTLSVVCRVSMGKEHAWSTHGPSERSSTIKPGKCLEMASGPHSVVFFGTAETAVAMDDIHAWQVPWSSRVSECTSARILRVCKHAHRGCNYLAVQMRAAQVSGFSFNTAFVGVDQNMVFASACMVRQSLLQPPPYWHATCDGVGAPESIQMSQEDNGTGDSGQKLLHLQM